MVDERTDKQLYEETKPIGERLIGIIDPQTLTREEFEGSPNLLYHGSSKPFTFSRDFDYHADNYKDLGDRGSSTTLGMGFYCTDNANAIDYSHVRASYSDKESNPYVTPLLPYQANCLDLRLKGDLSRNAPLPKEFIQKWVTFFQSSIQATERYSPSRLQEEVINKSLSDSPMVSWKPLPQGEGLRRHFERQRKDYRAWLTNLDEGKPVDLKQLLKTDRMPSPLWSYTFRDFMISQGYDGLIYIEASEKHDQDVIAYVFYNLNRIGTYETWHQQI